MPQADNQFINGQWVDTSNGNVYNSQTGIWSNPQGYQYINGQWVGANNTNATNATNSGYNPQAGYGYNLLNMGYQQQTYLSNLQAQQAMQLQQLNNAAQMQMNGVNNQLKYMLSQNQITHEQYQQRLSLAQQESEFARSMAQRSLEFQHQKELDNARVEIERAGEQRQERQLQANLAANPQDWVAYEFYKRSIANGATGAANPVAAGTPSTTGANGGQQTNAPTMLGGGAYAAAPPAYSDAAAQGLAANLFNPAGSSEGYNPNLRGTGVFGTRIDAPNTLTRGEAGNLSTSELGMLAGLLKGGIEINGKRVALDPADYFKQAENSWVPTLEEGGRRQTVYA